MSLKIGLFTLQKHEELNIGSTEIAIYIANHIAGKEGLSVAIVEPNTVSEELFKTAKADFMEDGTFFMNHVRFYPTNIEAIPNEDVLIYDFRDVNILHEFESDFNKLYVCSDGTESDLTDICEYIHDAGIMPDVFLVGGSKEKLALFTAAGFKSIILNDRKENRCPYPLSLQIDLVLRANGIIPPEYHKDWKYDEVVFNYVPEPVEDETKSGNKLFGLLKKQKKKSNSKDAKEEQIESELSDPVINDTLKSDDLDDVSIEVLERKKIRKSNRFSSIDFVDVPKPVAKPIVKDIENDTEFDKEINEPEIIEPEITGSGTFDTSDTIDTKVAEAEAKRLEQERIDAKKLEAERLERERIEAEIRKKKEKEAAEKALREENERLKYKATHDELTGVKNRNGFDEDFASLEIYALIAFDVNNLKTANDKFGHAEGDKLLTTVSNEIKKQFSNVYRMGGDEFNVLIPDAMQKDDTKIRQKLTNIDKALEKISETSTTVEYCTAYGVAYSTEGAKDSVLALADARMYENKKNKKQKSKTQDLRVVETKPEPVKEPEQSTRKGIMSFLPTGKKQTESETKGIKLPKFGPVKGTLKGGLSIFVTSIRHSLGASYISGSLASAMTDIYDRDVWFEHKDHCSLPDNVMVKEIVDDVDRFNAYKGGIVVQDKGIYEELSLNDRKDMMHADINVMICTADESDLQRLAQFIEAQGDAAYNWLYVFNHVQKSQERMLRAAMSDYSFIIVPSHDNAEVPQELQKEYLAAINYFTK